MLNNVSFSEFKEGSFIIQKITRNDYYQQNSYIILDPLNKNQIIIDPGDNAEFIEEIIFKNKNALTSIIFTHGHFDHIGASQYLCKKFNISCYVHQEDFKLVKQSPNYALLFEKKIIKAPSKLISLSNYSQSILQILHTPGHTSGSCCFLLGNSIFTGDTLLLKETGRTDLPGGSEKKLKESVALLFTLCNDSTTIYPGHGEIFNFTELKRNINQ